MPHNAYPHSYYAATAKTLHTYPQLLGAQHYDVCIIGAGMTGLSAALELAKSGFKVVVLEAKRIAWGASGRSGGQMIIGFGAHLSQMQTIMGQADAHKAMEVSFQALKLVKQRIQNYHIDCDMCLGQAEVATRVNHLPEFQVFQEQLAQEHNYPLEYWDKHQLTEHLGSTAYCGAWYDPQGGHIHPLNYTLGLAKTAVEAGVDIYENTPAQHISEQAPYTITTPQGAIHCQQTLIAANAYLTHLTPKLAHRILPVGSYICATKPLGSIAQTLIPNAMAIADSNFLTSYYRLSHDGRLLFGGRTGLTQNQPHNLEAVMKQRITHIFPQLQPVDFDYIWGGNIAVTQNRLPDINRLKNGIYYAHGFSGHGILMSNMAGKLVADAMRGEAEQFDVFSRIPHKPFFGGTYLRAPSLAIAMLYFNLMDRLGK